MTPLTPAQQAAVDALVTGHKIERVPVDGPRCQVYLELAAAALSDLPRVTHGQTRFAFAYAAAVSSGEALLATHGYRTLAGAGEHDTLGRFLAAILDTPAELAAAARHYGQMVREHDAHHLRGHPITAAAADAAVAAAETLYETARRTQVEEFPRLPRGFVRGNPRVARWVADPDIDNDGVMRDEPDIDQLQRAVVESFLDKAVARSGTLTLAELCARLGLDEAEVRTRAAQIAETRQGRP